MPPSRPLIQNIEDAAGWRLGGTTVTFSAPGDAEQGAYFDGPVNLFISGEPIFAGIDYVWPAGDGTAGQVLTTDGALGLSWEDAGSGSGDVTGPGSATNGGIAIFDGTTGKLIADSTVTLSDISSSISSAATMANWGSIGGTLSAQTDLQAALNAKAATGAVGSTGITMSTARLLGRSTAGTGAIEEITLGTNLSFTGTTLNATGGGGGGGEPKMKVWARDITPRFSNGCGDLQQLELTAGNPDIQYLPFADGVDSYAQFAFPMPTEWDAGGVTVSFYWTHPAATTFAVRWTAQSLARSSDDAIDVAYGTAVPFTASGGTTNDLYIHTVNIGTPAGTPLAGDVLFVQVGRLGLDGADTLDAEARLLFAVVTWTTT